MKKVTEKARIKRQAFVFKIVGVHSSLERGVKEYSKTTSHKDKDEKLLGNNLYS